MADSINCICGYRGPSVPEGNRTVCPICRTPAEGGIFRAPPPPPQPTGLAAAPAAFSQPAAQPAAAGPPASYRIPCPNGHELKAKTAMLGQQVVCPKCNAVFELRLENSREHRKEQAQQQEHREAAMAAKWLRRAIVAAVFIVASLAGMGVISFVYK